MLNLKYPLKKLLLSIFILSSLFLLGYFLVDIPPRSSITSKSTYSLSGDQTINMNVEVATSVYIGESFEYKVRVIYDPNKVKPDLRKLIREVRFLPFEQRHMSKSEIIESQFSTGEHEFLLSYPILGINVVPNNQYPLDPVELSYLDFTQNKNLKIQVRPGPINITGYYSEDVFGIPFQPLKGKISVYYRQIKFALAFGICFFFIVGGTSTYHSSRRRNIQILSMVDNVRMRFEEVKRDEQSTHQIILSYERIFLSLISHYRNLSARNFWLNNLPIDGSLWNENLEKLKRAFQLAYSKKEPGDIVIKSIQDSFENYFQIFEKDSVKEKLILLASIEGTVKQRIATRKYLFAGGIISIVAAVILLIFLARPSIWMDDNVALFNGWINSLPSKVFDKSKNNELGTLDIEFVGRISEEQEILEKVDDDKIKSAYLYNYGTVVSNAIIAIMTLTNEVEMISEDEPIEPPSFEFPVQLLANSVRFYPVDEDARKNLELAIIYLEDEDRDETGEVEGEVGPPVPGFSRDLSELLF